MKTWFKAEESSHYPVWFIALASGCLVYVLATAIAIYAIHQSFAQAQLGNVQALALTLRKGFHRPKMLGDLELRLPLLWFSAERSAGRKTKRRLGLPPL
jgi:hypothetical protein